MKYEAGSFESAKLNPLRELAFSTLRLLSRPFPGSWRVANARARARELLHYLVERTIPSKPVVCTTNHDFMLIVQPGIDRGVERAIYTRGSYEAGTLWAFSQILRPGDVFVDVGANIGLMSMHAARLVGDSGAVFSFEPMPDIFAQLKANIHLNAARSIRAFNLALGSEPGKLPIFAHPEVNRGSSTLLTAGATPSHIVAVSTLDAFAVSDIKRRIRMIKIDVEGWELEVLRGATNTLSGDAAPILCVECSEYHALSGGTLEDMFHEIACSKQYRCFMLSKGKDFPSPVVPIDSAEQLPKHDNLFCFPPGIPLPPLLQPSQPPNVYPVGQGRA